MNIQVSLIGLYHSVTKRCIGGHIRMCSVYMRLLFIFNFAIIIQF